jgi:hypothetical protein
MLPTQYASLLNVPFDKVPTATSSTVMPVNVPAVAEPAKTSVLKYCCFRNQATLFCSSPLLVAGWVEGRRRRPEPATDFVI